MALRPQLYPQVAYAYAAAACYTQNGYQRQDGYYSRLGYAQQQGNCSDNGVSSMQQQMKCNPNMATLPQPSKHQEVGHQGYYGQHNNGWNGNHQSYPNYPNGANTYETISYGFYAQGHCPPYY